MEQYDIYINQNLCDFLKEIMPTITKQEMEDYVLDFYNAASEFTIQDLRKISIPIQLENEELRAGYHIIMNKEGKFLLLNLGELLQTELLIRWRGVQVVRKLEINNRTCNSDVLYHIITSYQIIPREKGIDKRLEKRKRQISDKIFEILASNEVRSISTKLWIYNILNKTLTDIPLALEQGMLKEIKMNTIEKKIFCPKVQTGTKEFFNFFQMGGRSDSIQTKNIITQKEKIFQIWELYEIDIVAVIWKEMKFLIEESI